MILNSSDRDILPYSQWVNGQTENGLTSYSYGPSGVNVPTLKSGEYYTTRWGCILLNGSPTFAILDGLNDRMDYNTPGSKMLNFQNDLNLKNISFCFDNSGRKLFAAQFENTSNIWYESGLTIHRYNWQGVFPCLFNTVQVNFPPKIPDYQYPIWNTGETYCFYQNNDNVYYRLLSENFTSEYLAGSGTTAFSGNAQVGILEEIEPNSNNPFRFVLIQNSNDRERVKTFSSASYTNLAFTNFKQIATGILNLEGLSGRLGYEYGKWARYNDLGRSSGYMLEIQSKIYDTYLYSTGEFPSLFPITVFKPIAITGYYIQTINRPFSLLAYDNMNEYVLQNNLFTFDHGHSLSGYYDFPSLFIGRSFNQQSLTWDSLSRYNTGKIKFLRRTNSINCPVLTANIFRTF
jgi:hypothetical protein